MMQTMFPNDGLPESAFKCLLLLARKDHFGLLREDRLLVAGKIGTVSVRAGSASLAVSRRLEEEGLAAWQPAGRALELRITPAGHNLIDRQGKAEEAPERSCRSDEARRPITVNVQESPLAWLRSRRDKTGQPMIDAAAFEAGERFRNDLAMSGILPRVTADWSATVRGSGWRGGLLPSEALTAARQRVRKTLDAVGPEFSGLLIDLCGFLKGLETIERERQWPPRSAKVPVQMALAALARHYGLSGEARGPRRSFGIKRWNESEAPTGHGATILQLAEYRSESRPD